ncbi:hypothetical protein BKA83DRAFT_685024 [Pisolithus microcarpus]|nr:hypothetical protein BKA83DRAFT_685024 [Pisolithus microcarpus]
MMQGPLLSTLVGTQVLSAAATSADTWCGKNYMSSMPPVSPGGNFPIPAQSNDPLLAFQCVPAIRPYLAEDTSAAVLIDSAIVYYEIANARTIYLDSGPISGGELEVNISLNGNTLGTATVPLNATAYEIPFNLQGIQPQMSPYNLSCEAAYNPVGRTPQAFSASTSLYVLPNPPSGAVTKMDYRTGGLLARPATGAGGSYEPVFPIGFYTQFDGYLSKNLSLVDELKAQGFTIIHPVPTFSNMTAFLDVVDRMQEVGLYIMYDMRLTYMNSSSVTEQVNALKNRPNLLLWYTADEPDGTSDPLSATISAYDLIYDLDGYHPVSLVLNCQDYYWANYTAGADIVMQDVYMIGNNVSFSSEWGTVCTPDYGDCGCDNCVSIPPGDSQAVPPNSTLPPGSVPANSGIGSYFNIADRVSRFKNRLEVMGWQRTKAVWTVPQAFGESQYWTRRPTGEEWVVETILGINHGALGVVPWADPTSNDIKASASAFAKSLPKITPFFFDAQSALSRTNCVFGGIDVATWTNGWQTLVLAANTDYVNETFSWNEIGHTGAGLTVAFQSGSLETTSDGFTLGPVSSGALVLSGQQMVVIQAV